MNDREAGLEGKHTPGQAPCISTAESRWFDLFTSFWKGCTVTFHRKMSGVNTEIQKMHELDQVLPDLRRPENRL